VNGREHAAMLRLFGSGVERRNDKQAQQNSGLQKACAEA
jgi:hypothetical protein